LNQEAKKFCGFSLKGRNNLTVVAPLIFLPQPRELLLSVIQVFP